MHHPASDDVRDVVVFINDFNAEYLIALQKLSIKLGRQIRGVILLDKSIKDAGINRPDTDGNFQTIICDFHDLTSLSNAVNSIRTHLLLVSSSSERNQPYLKLALPHMPYILGPSESSLDWATHKDIMRKLLSSYDPHLSPKSSVVNKGNEYEISNILDSLNFPLIIKPNGLAASVLVTKVENEAELRSRLKRDFEVIADIYTRDSGRGVPSMVVEEFIEGDMYSIDAYVSNEGMVWNLPLFKVTTAYAAGEEGFYSYRIDNALSLTQSEINDAHAVATKAVHALGLRSCVAHIELFKTSQGWKIIELGPRAGGYRQEIYELSYGIDHAYNELLVKSGLSPELPNALISYSSVVHIYAKQEGVITSIDGFDKAKGVESVKYLTCYKQAGDIALFCGNGGKYIVDGILSNTDLPTLQHDTDAIRQLIHINVDN